MKKKRDLTGLRFGRLVVIADAPPKIFPCGRSVLRCLCRCDCGQEKVILRGPLRTGATTSCGCYAKECARARSKAAHPSWRGGRYYKDGYVLLHNPEGYEIRSSRSFPEHVVIMEKLLGRRLTKEETVHHKNGIRDDNRPENLELWASRHPKGQRAADLVAFAKEILARYDSPIVSPCCV